MMQPIPIDRVLVPPAAPAVPADAQVVDVLLTAGLPFAISLDADAALVLRLSTGLATEWRTADPTASVAAAQDQEPFVPSGESDAVEPAAARPYLTLERGDRSVAVVPIVAGVHRVIEVDEGRLARRYDVWILDWDLRAGTVLGPGAFGSRVRLAWRAADRASSTFAPPPVRPAVVRRIPPFQMSREEIARLEPLGRARLKKGLSLR